MASSNTVNGVNVVSFGNTPQAKDDLFILGTEDQVQAALYRAVFDVMLNDLGGNAKTLYSIDNSVSAGGAAPTDLTVQDGKAEATSTDTSLLGAKIWITADGKVGYDASAISSTIQGLNDGQSLTDQFTYAIRLGNGTLSWATAVVKINGANDAPTLASVAAASIVENNNLSTTTDTGLGGTLVGSDVDDATSTLRYDIVGGTDNGNGTVSITGAFGTLTVNKTTGAYTFAKNGSAIEALDQGDTGALSFTVRVTDPHGASATQAFNLTVTGGNDVPTLDAVTAGALGEVDQSSTTTSSGLSGTLVKHDVDADDTHTFGILGGVDQGNGTVTLAGTYGTLTVNKTTGAYTYTPNGAVEGLDQGETAHDDFTVNVTDSHGAPASQTFTVNLTGADDAPTLDAVVGGSVTEVNQSSSETPAGLSGTLQGHDVDVETLTYGLVGGVSDGAGHVSVTGTYGALTVTTATGAYSYAPNTTAIEALDDGAHPVDNFTFTVSDGDGPTVNQAYTVTINGADDAPTLAPVTAGSVTEVTQSSTETPAGLSGNLVGHDVDAGDTLTYGLVGGVSDGAGHVSVTGTYGALTVTTATGAYSYAPNTTAIEALDDGAHPVDNFTFTVSDGDGPTVNQAYTVTINGADDAPTLAPVTAGSVTEVTQSSSETPAGLSGTLVGHDVDAGDTLTYGIVGGVSNDGGVHVSLTNTYGTLTVTAATGAYVYTPNPTAIEALDDGAHPVDTFTVTVSDGDGPTVNQTYSVTINGADDAPTLAPVAAGSVTEVDQSSTETPAGLSGTLVGHDVDTGDVLTYGIVGGTEASGVVTLAGTYGTLAVTVATGAYVYTPNPTAIEALDDGAHPVDNFTVTVSDGDDGVVTQVYAVTINGADDAPTLAPVTAGSVTEVDQSSTETPAGLSGTLVGHDVDAGDTLTYGIVGGVSNDGGVHVSLTNTYGTLTVTAATGAYTYTPNPSAIEALDDGAHPVDTFTVTVSDGDGPTVDQAYSVTINGADDAPTLAPVTAGSVTEVDQSSTETPAGLSGTLVGHDVDAGDTLSYGIVGGTEASGVVTLAGTYGTLAVTVATGAYTYTPNPTAIEALDDGAHPVDTFTVTVSDGDGPAVTQTYAVTINGADDAPTLAPVTAGSVTEVDQSSTETPAGLSGTLVGHDVDAGDTLTYGIVGGVSNDGGVHVSLTNTYGTLTVTAATGAYTYTPNPSAIEALDDGAHPVDNFTVTVSDGDGSAVTQTYAVTINGADDAPALAPVTAGSVTEVDQSSSETPAGLSGTLVGHDVDAGDTLSYGIVGGTEAAGVVTLAGTYGTLAVTVATGAYTYTPNPSAIEALDDGAQPVDNFTVTVSDGDDGVVSQTYSVTINGADDAPTLAPVTAGSVTEVDQSSTETPAGLSGTLVGHDVDAGDTLSYGIVGGTEASGVVSLAGTYGTLAVTVATGAYTYTPNPTAIEALDDGAHPVDNFTVTVSDGDGPAVTQTYAVTINGADDAPTLAPVTATIAENALASTTTTTNLTGTLSGHDVDAGDVLTYGLTGGVDNGDGTVSVTTTYGVLTVTTSTGHYDFTPNAAAIEALADGAHPQVVVGTTVSDGDDGLVTSTFTLDLTGANDAPVAVADTGSAGENETKSFDVLANDTDVDAGDSKTLDSLGTVTVTSTNAAVNGISAGSAFSIDSNQVKFTPGTLFDHLAAGESATVTVDYTVKDALGASSTSTLTLTVGGANDAPVLTGDLAATVNEGGSVVLTTADIGFTDVDDSASGVTFTISDLSNGALLVNGSAATTFTYADLVGGLVSFQHDGSETTSAGFKVVVEDGNEDASTPTASDFVITVTPVNDAPVNTIGSAFVVAEDTLVGLTGLSIADVDSGSGILTTTLTVEHGYLLIGSVPGGALADTSVFGQITLTGTLAQINASLADNNVKYQGAANFNGPDTLHMVTNDGGNTGLGGAQIDTDTKSITVTAVNDAPTAAAPATLSVNEDASVAVTGLSIADVDAASGTVVATLSVLNGAVTVGGSPAGVILGANGTGSVTLTGTVAAINAALGNVAYAGSANYNGSDTLTLGVNDGGNSGSGGALTGSASTAITVNAVNDAPVNTIGSAVVVAEDTLVGLTGLSIADVDAGLGTVTTTLTVEHGYLLIGSVPGGALADTSVFGQITLTGTVAQINASLADNNVKYQGAANFNGPDTFHMVTNDGGATGLGGALIDTDTKSITVTPVNDAPTLAAVTASAIAEVNQSSSTTSSGLSGTLAGADVDNDTLTYGIQGGTVASGVSTLAGTYGTLTVNLTSGAYTYAPNAAAIEGLDVGENPTDSFTVTVSDGVAPAVTRTFAVNLTGADDAPTLAAVTNGAIAEVAGSSSTTSSGLSGTLVGSDVDVETLTYGVVGGVSDGAGHVSVTTAYGTLQVTTATGAYQFTPNAAAIEGLDGGENPTLNFTFTVSDGDAPLGTTAYAINLTGADDNPTLAAVTNGSVAEVAGSATRTTSGLSGTLVGSDVDTENLTYGIQGGTVAAGVSTLAGAYGTLSVNVTTGAYTYAVNAAAVEGLDTGETPNDVFTFTVSDGDAPLGTTSYTVNLTGADDNPTLAAVANGSVAEVAGSSSTASSGLSGTLVGSDVDTETLTYGIQGGTVAAGVSTLAGAYGTLSVHVTTGAYTYTPNAAAVEGLDTGETPNDVFTFTVSDGDAPLGTTSYTVNLTGADDNPTLAAVTNGSVAEVANSTSLTTSNLSGTLSGSDVDTETLTYGVQGGTVAAGFSTLAGAYGTLSVNTTTGEYNYTPNSAAIEPLNTGDNKQDNFTFTVSDGDAPLGTTSYTVNVTGANDAAPAVASNDTLLVSIGTPATFSAATLLANDTTSQPNPHLEVISVTGTGIVFNYNTQTFTLTGAASAGSATATYVMSDGTNSATGSITITTVDASANTVNLSSFGTYQGAYIDAGNGQDTVSASGGFNTLLGGNGQDVLNGSSGNDILQGGQSNDTLDGGGGIDLIDFSDTSSGITMTLVQSNVLNSAGGDDYKNMEGVIGSTGNDNITGSSGDDWLYGVAGNDTLNGAGGNDHIIGGLGKDTMIGGAGSDVFVFQTISDSANTAANADIINDFNAALDLIDVSQIDAQSPAPHTPFIWGGQSASLIANGVTWTETSGNTIISFDTDGNAATAEMRIVLVGTGLGLTANSFIF